MIVHQQLLENYIYIKTLFCGDSVTKGWACEATENNPDSTGTDKNYEWSYQSRFHDMFPSIDVTVIASSGIFATDWKNTH